jgi:hypothetical protein
MQYCIQSDQGKRSLVRSFYKYFLLQVEYPKQDWKLSFFKMT